MRLLLILIYMLLSCVSVHAFETMSEPEMKNATGQLATVVGDLSSLANPVTSIAGDFGPALAPVGPVVFIYDIVSPHVDPASDLGQANDSAKPVTRIMRATGDLSAFGGMFF